MTEYVSSIASNTIYSLSKVLTESPFPGEVLYCSLDTINPWSSGLRSNLIVTGIRGLSLSGLGPYSRSMAPTNSTSSVTAALLLLTAWLGLRELSRLMGPRSAGRLSVRPPQGCMARMGRCTSPTQVNQTASFCLIRKKVGFLRIRQREA